jgi:hypothetical protein
MQLKQSRLTAILPAAVAALFLLAQPAASAESDGFMQFSNALNYNIVVDILHSNGERQKGETIKPGKGHGFKFSGCNDKNRKFEIRKQSDNFLLASGSFSFQNVYETGGPAGGGECTMRIEEPPAAQKFLPGLAVKYEKVKLHRGRYRIYME